VEGSFVELPQNHSKNTLYFKKCGLILDFLEYYLPLKGKKWVIQLKKIIISKETNISRPI